MTVMSPLTLDHRLVGFANAANCKFTASQVLALMLFLLLWQNTLFYVSDLLLQMQDNVYEDREVDCVRYRTLWTTASEDILHQEASYIEVSPQKNVSYT